jgi:hypothetical protein
MNPEPMVHAAPVCILTETAAAVPAEAPAVEETQKPCCAQKKSGAAECASLSKGLSGETLPKRTEDEPQTKKKGGGFACFACF